MISPPNDALADEILSINSIYSDSTLTPISASTNLYSLYLPSLPSIALRIEFPNDYPDTPPSILGTQTVGDDVAKGVGNQVVEIVRGVLARLYQPGSACVFDLLEESREALEKAKEDGVLHTETHGEDASNTPPSNTHTSQDPTHTNPPSKVDLGPEPPWTVAPPITEKKSLFLARSARVTSPLQAQSYLRHFLATDKKAAKATHNITAWRIRGVNDTSYQDCDDDGETAAGGRILHLMQLMDVWDVMVVVTRWYGGVLLGPDRFRIMNTVAREALVLRGVVEGGAKENEKDGGGEERKKKGKK
ncbi:impact family protein [Clohesyomyces aquaticus]|uniref:Impact family protein n=1 Tax=Clohesyomyces aquaticus TaxID=1231657 RepID=A0A1Y1YGT0_9PLEO|nr:impact family protein [Clohesyomyces aquaticus]